MFSGGIKHIMNTVGITYNLDTNEYRVFWKDEQNRDIESKAYYTDDADDAVETLVAIVERAQAQGDEVQISKGELTRDLINRCHPTYLAAPETISRRPPTPKETKAAGPPPLVTPKKAASSFAKPRTGDTAESYLTRELNKMTDDQASKAWDHMNSAERRRALGGITTNYGISSEWRELTTKDKGIVIHYLKQHKKHLPMGRFMVKIYADGKRVNEQIVEATNYQEAQAKVAADYSKRTGVAMDYETVRI